MRLMKPSQPRILTINGGSSSIKFALFEADDSFRRILEGGIERIGLPEATLRVKGLNQADNFSRLVTAPDHTVAVGALMDWIEERIGRDFREGQPGHCPRHSYGRGMDDREHGLPHFGSYA